MCHILYLLLKTKLLNCHCTGYTYFIYSSTVYLDPLCFDLAVAHSNKKKKKKKKEEEEKKKKMEIFGYFIKCRKL